MLQAQVNAAVDQLLTMTQRIQLLAAENQAMWEEMDKQAVWQAVQAWPLDDQLDLVFRL